MVRGDRIIYIESYEEMNVIENIALKPNNSAEKITEAIIEMNIMRKERVSVNDLIKLIK